MATKIELYECNECHEVLDDREKAAECAIEDARAMGYAANLGMHVLELWECDGEGCGGKYDNEGDVLACEARHEMEGVTGRPKGGGVLAWFARVFS